MPPARANASLHLHVRSSRTVTSIRTWSTKYAHHLSSIQCRKWGLSVRIRRDRLADACARVRGVCQQRTLLRCIIQLEEP